jgi:hypothetical protein
VRATIGGREIFLAIGAGFSSRACQTIEAVRRPSAPRTSATDAPEIAMSATMRDTRPARRKRMTAV